MKCSGLRFQWKKASVLQMAFDVPPIDLEDPNDIYGRLGRKISWSVMGPTLYPVVTKDAKKDSIDNNDYSVDVSS